MYGPDPLYTGGLAVDEFDAATTIVAGVLAGLAFLLCAVAVYRWVRRRRSR